MMLGAQLLYTVYQLATNSNSRFIAWMCINLLQETCIFVYVLQLWIFHLRLVYLGQTTRDVIKRRETKNKAKGCLNCCSMLCESFVGYY
jgi:hypothetical protein